MDKKLILEVLGRMQEYFGREIKPSVIPIYVEHLGNLDEKQFKAASVVLMQTFEPTSARPFPLIRDFLAACGEDGHTRAVNVVSAVKRAIEKLGQYPSVSFGDPALHSTIMRYGGWADLVCWNEQDWQFHERNFIAAYESARAANIQGPSHLPGVCEIENKKNGWPNEKPVQICAKTGKILLMPKPITQIIADHFARLASEKPALLEVPSAHKRMTVREILKSNIGKETGAPCGSTVEPAAVLSAPAGRKQTGMAAPVL